MLDASDDGLSQSVAAKVAGIAGGGTFVFGLSVNEAAAVTGALVAIVSLVYQIWKGQRQLRLQRIATRLKAVQKDVKHMDERLTETGLPALKDYDK